MAGEILLLGKNGQVGWELQRSLAPLGKVIALGSAECDLAEPTQLRTIVHSVKPAVIVNAAAYTAVDKAENDADRARAINSVAPEILAEEALGLGALLVHYSTDYVFDGSKSDPYSEADFTSPLSVYGASKLAGEHAIQRVNCRHLIFRTSWVFAARGGNFAKTILRLARTRESLKIVGDQFGAPTSAELIADITAHCLYEAQKPQGQDTLGLYNLVSNGATSWHGYARFVLEFAAKQGYELKCHAEKIESIPTEGYPLPAKRPANSRLDTAKLKQQFGLYIPDWTYHVERMLTELLTKETV
jgi:dTDP-4-dehydrorhamnose reductase